jgi:hypothetical protein
MKRQLLPYHDYAEECQRSANEAKTDHEQIVWGELTELWSAMALRATLPHAA